MRATNEREWICGDSVIQNSRHWSKHEVFSIKVEHLAKPTACSRKTGLRRKGLLATAHTQETRWKDCHARLWIHGRTVPTKLRPDETFDRQLSSTREIEERKGEDAVIHAAERLTIKNPWSKLHSEFRGHCGKLRFDLFEEKVLLRDSNVNATDIVMETTCLTHASVDKRVFQMLEVFFRFIAWFLQKSHCLREICTQWPWDWDASHFSQAFWESWRNWNTEYAQDLFV